MNIVFAGNRQCEFIASVFRTLAAQISAIRVSYVNDDGDFNDRSDALVRSADVILLQERGVARNFDIDETNLTAKRYSFPEISVDFIWPFGGQSHPRNRPHPDLPQGPFPDVLGDAYLNRRIQTSFSPDISSEYISMQINHLIDLDAYKEAVLDRQARIDEIVGTNWAGAIRSHFAQRPILRNPLHPTPWVLSEIFAKLLSATNLGISFADKEIHNACAATPESPVHPSVARHFDLRWASEGRRYQLRQGDRVSFREYTRRYLAYAEGPELEVGVRAIAQQDYALALENLRAAVQRPSGRGSHTAQTALSRALMECGDGANALETLATARAIEPENIETSLQLALILAKLGRPVDAENELRAYFDVGGSDAHAFVVLADIYSALGKHREAAQALRSALAEAGGNAGLQSRLTLTLAASGDLAAAVESAEAEISLAPDNPHPRAYISSLLMRLGRQEDARAQIEAVLAIIEDRQGYDELRHSVHALYRQLNKPPSLDRTNSSRE